MKRIFSRKVLSILLSVALIASGVLLIPSHRTVYAQGGGTVITACSAGGTVVAPLSAGQNYLQCPLTSATNITSFSFATPSGALPASQVIYVVFEQPASGTAATVTFASGIGSQTVTATLGVNTVITFFYDVTTNHYYTAKLTT
jgi:hypothetical protein